MKEVMILEKNELYQLCGYIHSSILEGLKESNFSFSIDDIFGDKTENNWEILKGCLLAFIHNGRDKWKDKK